MTSPRFSVQKFNDLARHFRLGDAVIQLAEMILDGRSLPLSWQGQLIVQDVGNAYVRIVGSIRQPSPLDLVPGDFFDNPTRFKELRAIADMRLPICVGDGWIVLKGFTHPGTCTVHLSFNSCQNGSVEKSHGDGSCLIEARLPETSLRSANSRTNSIGHTEDGVEAAERSDLNALTGEVDGYKYRVTSQSGDLAITIRRDEEERQSSKEENRFFYESFLEVFRWLNGGCPYIYHYQEWDPTSRQIGEKACDVFVPYTDIEEALDSVVAA